MTTRTHHPRTSDKSPHLSVVEDYKPGLIERASDKIRANGGDPRKVAKAGGALLLTAGLTVGALAGLAAKNGAEVPKDNRTEQNQAREDAVLRAFVNSGKTEVMLGDATVSAVKGRVIITPENGESLNLRKSLGRQDHVNNNDKWDTNVDVKVGYNYDDQRDNFAVMDDPIIVRYANGDVFMGGIMADENGNVPEIKTIEDFEKHVNWAYVSELEKQYSGAIVDTNIGSESDQYAVTVGVDGLASPMIRPAHLEDISKTDPGKGQKIVYGQ